MSDRRLEKVAIYNLVSSLFENSDFLYFITYNGMSVAQFSEFRGLIRKAGCGCVVLKNSYIKLGLESKGIELAEDFDLTGDTAVVSGQGEPCSVAKVIKNFDAKTEDEKQFVNFKSGVIDGKFQDEAACKELADLPPKEVLLSQLVMLMKTPGSKLVQTISMRRNSIVWLLDNYVKKLENNS